jgi:hypothetical protein
MKFGVTKGKLKKWQVDEIAKHLCVQFKGTFMNTVIKEANNKS